MGPSTSVAFDADTALVVVDMQNDFADPAGSLYVQGGEEVVGRVNALVEAASGAGSMVAYSQDWHPPVTPHFAKDGGIWPVHCVAETWGAELHPDLLVRGPVVRKGSGGEDGYSAFTMRDPSTGETSSTGLDGLLRDAGTRRLVIVGLATDYCVVATALDARSLGYATSVIEEAIRAVDLSADDGARAIARMRDAGVAVVVEDEAPSSGSDH